MLLYRTPLNWEFYVEQCAVEYNYFLELFFKHTANDPKKPLIKTVERIVYVVQIFACIHREDDLKNQIKFASRTDYEVPNKSLYKKISLILLCSSDY